MKERDIISEIQQGNRHAFRHAFTNHYKELIRYAYTIMKDDKEAEDVVQECFAILLGKPALWEKIKDIRGYLMRMVHNQCMWKIRERQSQEKKYEKYAHWANTTTYGGLPEVLRDINQHENESLVQYLMSVLTPMRRQAIELVYIEQLSYAEASDRMGISKNSLKTHLKLAMVKLRSLIHILLVICMCIRIQI
ncbi:RNA polymerase sigma factor [Chitinophaga sp. XS-30]|uniref:RNA polymerase sigma factor n=1 Tax=Chitinophaga sp. XS-30 TaxID=2604421 RepID=UPI0011DCFDC3|nr:RNA polymerase sigma factor [Chitinophaga sp. XS-30]QEH43187.1 RNA polymerase sigma factor [Chitinophaga sp. XS-30]